MIRIRFFLFINLKFKHRIPSRENEITRFIQLHLNRNFYKIK